MTIYISTRRCSLKDLIEILFYTDEFFRAYPPSEAMRKIYEENEKRQYEYGLKNEETFEGTLYGWHIQFKPDDLDHEKVIEFKSSRKRDNPKLQLEAYVQACAQAKLLGLPFFETWIEYNIIDTSGETPQHIIFLEKKRYQTDREWPIASQFIKKAIDILENARNVKNYVKNYSATTREEKLAGETL